MGRVIKNIKEISSEPTGYVFLKKPPELRVGNDQEETHAQIMRGIPGTRVVCGGSISMSFDIVVIINAGGSSIGWDFKDTPRGPVIESLKQLPDAKGKDIG